MNTNLYYLTILCIIGVLISFAHSNENEEVTLLEQVFGKTNSHWFAKAEDLNVTVGDASQTRIIPPDLSEDRFLSTTQLAAKYGYKVKEHTVFTADGYILTLMQIIGKGPVVFLMHGILGSSDDFVVSGPGKALAYELVDAGYNVWLGNARGNKYSRKHTYLDPNYQPFWEFSFHEIGVFDLPAMVDHALMDSKSPHLTYIGHGQGTTVFFVLNSDKPEYNKKFNFMFSLGTTAWTWHVRSPVLRSLIPIPNSQFELLKNLGFYEIFPANPTNKFISAKLCCSSKLNVLTCMSALFSALGYDYSQIDYKNVCVQLAHFPSGSSLRQLEHFVQNARSKRFAHFDFGKEKNLVVYKSPYPPSYDVTKIFVPVVAFYADNDLISSLDDTLIIMQRLPKFLFRRRVPHSSFNHFDYIWGTDADLLVYWKIMNILVESGLGPWNGTACYDDDNNKCVGR